MTHYPDNLRYTRTHEWVRDEGDQTYTVGVTDHAQGMLGDVVFVELPELDAEVSVNDEVAVIESVKTAADIYSPLAGRIISINEALTATPDKINHDPYGEGWLFQIKLEDPNSLEGLLDANGYEQSIGQ